MDSRDRNQQKTELMTGPVFVPDNILAGKPPICWRLSFSREVFLGRVLFHEIGHHINRTVGSLAAGEEASGDEWRRRRGRIHFQTKYWYFGPGLKPLLLIVGWLGTPSSAQCSAA